MRVLVFSVAVVVFSACSSGSSSPTNGSKIGAFIGGDFENDGSMIQLRIATFDGLCAIRQAGGDKANGAQLEIDLALATGKNTIPAGTLPVAATEAVGAAKVSMKTWDASCNEASKLTATSGSLTLATAIGDPSAPVSGTYSLSFEDGSTQSGSFTALAFCDTANGTKTNPCAQ